MKLLSKKSLLIGLPISVMLLTTSCKKDTVEPEEETPAPSGPTYNIPTTYNFTSADFTSSTQRLSMLGEMITYIRSTHTTTQTTQPTILAQKLKDMYGNANNQFTLSTLNTSGIQLKDKTDNTFSFQTILEASFDDAEPASNTAATNPTVSSASNGVKGKLVTSTRAILVDANGLEYKELAEKGLMGSVLYYQAMTILKNIATYDNVTKVNGITAQEKAWDEAFGYFGVPVDFPTNTTGLKYWGSYCNSVNVAIGSNSTIMDAFLKGRAAVSNGDAARRDSNRDLVMATWEKVVAAKCISYLKGAKNNLSDISTLHHNLSEGYGFIKAFKYNPSKTISDPDIALLEGYLGTNFYNLVPSNLDNAINKLAAVFNLNASLIP
jgi:hypothetical protein